MKNQKAFKALFSGLCETFGREVSDSLSRIYWAVLSRYDDADVDAAIMRGIAKWTFFPKPAEIIREIEGDPEARAWAAWETFLLAKSRVGPQRSVVFEDPAIPVVVERLGGWSESGVFSWLEKDYPFRRAEFLRAYNAAAGERHEQSRALIGWADAENAARGYTQWVRPPVCIGMRAGVLMIDGVPEIRNPLPAPARLLIEDDPADRVPVAEVVGECMAIIGGAKQAGNRGGA